MDLYERQSLLEEESIKEGVNRYRRIVANTPLDSLPTGIELLRRALEPMAQAIEAFKVPHVGGEYLGRMRTILQALDTYEVAYIATRRLINCIVEDEPVQIVAIDIGNQILDHLNYLKFRDSAPNLLKKVESNIHSPNMHHKRVVVAHARHKFGIDEVTWDQEAKLHLGCKLIDLFIGSTGLVQKELDFKKRYYLTGHDDVRTWLKTANEKYEIMEPYLLPMVVPPVAWTNPSDGGYLSNYATFKHKLVRTNNGHYLNELAGLEMPQVYRAVNAIQATPWRINRKILDVLKRVWSEGGILGKLPARDDPELPTKPWSSDEEFEQLNYFDPDVVKAWKRKATEIYDLRVKVAGKRTGVFQKIRIAEKFRDDHEIYFPVNLDWRGRIYPLPPTTFIGPQGDDTGRALIEFSRGLPLGDRGAYWLAVHLANTFGAVDKKSFDIRVKWVMDNEQLIVDSAENPLDGQRFWCEADKPYQFLAACFEWAGYKREGINFVSHLPIQMDATCSGLQHLSALLLDEVGGKAVNLVPGDEPADIYSEVKRVLISMVEQDAVDGVGMAHVWKERIDRKICKRAVMTYPYSVTKRGVVDQLMDELDERYVETGEHWLATDDNLRPCLYLGKRLYEATTQVVIAACSAMGWLQEVVKVCNKANISVGWVTPAGFKVRQEYRKYGMKRIKTFFGGIACYLSLKRITPKLDTRKQVLGIAANLTHSLDSSHLMATVNKCIDNQILDFSMIHDSYGTHSCNVDKLHEILRDTFIEQYAGDFLEDFRNQVLEQLPPEYHSEIPPVPQKGSLDIQQVKNSKYLFC